MHLALDALGGTGHVCFFYEAQQDCLQILRAFVEVGMSRGEKCLCVVSRSSEQSFREALRAARPFVDRASSPPVELLILESVYLASEGISTQRALHFWRKAQKQAIAAGFSGLRGIVQADQAVARGAALARWIEYENGLTRMLAKSGGAILCLYNRSVQPAELVRDALLAHATVAHQGAIGRNTFHVPPEEYSASNRAGREADRILASLGNRWRRESRSRLATGRLSRSASRRLSEVLEAVKDFSRSIRGLADGIAERKREEREHVRYSAYLALGQEITRTGSWAWNPSSGRLFWSREHFRIFGLDPTCTNASYALFFGMVHPEERSHVEREFQEAVAAGSDFDGEYRIVHPDGLVKYIHSRAHPVFGESGELTEYVGTVADITEMRHGEESLGSMQVELDRTSRGITLGQLAASIAHEVNQPLAAVIANANAALRWLAKDTPRIGKARQALSRIVRDGNRATDVIARVRALTSRTDGEHAPLNLNSVVHEVVALLRTELRRNHVSVRTALAEKLPPIQGDRVQMQQVLLNLIMNAIEAMSAVMTRPRLLAITTTLDDMGIAVSVEDCGVGLEDHTLERVFEPFYTTKPTGTGIGLAISRSIIEAHGGRIWAVCNTPSGAIFRFSLPFEEAGTG